jgi:hypothetical protein
MRWAACFPLVGLLAVACGGRWSVGTNDAGPPPDAAEGQLTSDKIDIVFVIDNSSSMGTKQDILRRAISDFLDRIIFPPCVNPDNTKIELPRVDAAKCPPGFVEKYKAISDLHVGVLTSSLGGGGGDQCDPYAHITMSEAPTLTNFYRHNDDAAHLINRKKPDPSNPPLSGEEDPILNAIPANFLAWLPSPGGKPMPPVSPYGALPSDRLALYNDFGELVRGAQEFGCGLEAQLEAFYRFLIQPDPYNEIELDKSFSPAQAQLIGVDPIVLQQRHDFLRPDSIVAVIVVTDEEDSWSDPMWLAGRGWITRSQNNNYSTGGLLPRATSACAQSVDPNDPMSTGPNSPMCTWCAISNADPECKKGTPPYGVYLAGEDGLNVRYTDDMKRRYGMNPQFPISRYVDGLTSPMVPDRVGEHTTAQYKQSNLYVGRKTCTNPLFAKTLPTDPNGELCKLEPGPRNESLVFFGIIGGVPWQLLTNDPVLGGAFKSTLTDADWMRILGKDPATYQSEGIDPHMVESINPRTGIVCGTGAPDTCDPYHSREYDTKTAITGIDLQYACTFLLPQPIDCTSLPAGATCDCNGIYKGPLCAPNPNDNMNTTLQIRGKAYPTIRELRVAKELGPRAIVGSICPRSSVDPNDPDYGYRPALRALVEHMQIAIATPPKSP